MTTTSDVTTSTVTLFSLTSVNFKGWYSESNGGITASFCPPNLETLVAGGPDDAFVDCCATSGCSFPASCTQCGVPTACFEGSIQVFNAKTTDTYGNTGYYTYNCWEGITMTCDSVTIFEQHAQSTDGWSKTAQYRNLDLDFDDPYPDELYGYPSNQHKYEYKRIRWIF
ncbi:hypothetical protein N7466_006072 [Penicillium verhagenii]|uniref:uncharacterized protein n=1 Tax=Penicillium verhagenii TaxID=1562060 RepID=UPI0025451FED|nr:uncharacterized protein N7466_006072 [Penicillium verhagenii]KAJ5930579.1 hypothetical protein N7466_006072 [Penicillium verhagenii]